MRPLAALIRRRVELGIDANIHDATYWLSEFACPEKVGGEIMYDSEGEVTLAIAAFAAEDPSKLPSSDARIDELFVSDIRANAYRALRDGSISDGNDFEHKLVAGELGEPEGLTVYEANIKHGLNECVKRGFMVNKEHQAATLQSLHEIAERRKRYNREAQAWLQTHGTTPREKLVNAWKARRAALRDGAEDNPNAILAWERENGIKRAFAEMEEEGTLPPNIDLESLDTNRGFINELSRFYESRTIIRALGDFLEKYSPEAVFPAGNVELSDGYRVEVFAKNDPRNLTIGQETRCCMTPSGEARSCVEAAYGNPDVSIMALYDPDGDVAAHSVMFTRPGIDPSAIVLDNIETNEGRDRNRVVDLYREFFAEYLRHEAMGGFDTVNLGKRHDEEYLTPLKATRAILSPLNYSDAEEQVLLYQKDPDFGPAFVPMTRNFVNIYVPMEKAIYGHDSTPLPPASWFSSQKEPWSHSYVIIAEDGETRGYVMAAEVSEEEALDETDMDAKADQYVLYVADLAILPQYQGLGYGRKAIEGMLKIAARRKLPLLFQAHDSTSWPIIQSKRAELEDRGFRVEVLDHDTDYFDTGKGAHLVKISKTDPSQ